jgi:flavin reductase (DIM6/NTAB) family NADH-FMN oxidoreductase RutF
MTDDDAPSSFDSYAYRRALGGFGTGVALVAAHDKSGRAHGLIVNSLTSVSPTPAPPSMFSQMRRPSR